MYVYTYVNFFSTSPSQSDQDRNFSTIHANKPTGLSCNAYPYVHVYIIVYITNKNT